MRQAALGALFVVGLATACGGNGAGDPIPEVSLADVSTSTTTARVTTTTTLAPTTTTAESTTTVAPTSTTAPPALTEEEQIIAVIDEYWTAIIAAHDPPDPDSPLFDEVAGPAFAQILRDAAADRLAERKGIHLTDPTPVTAVAVALQHSADGRLLADACLRDSAVSYDLDTGEVLDDSTIFIRSQFVFESDGDNWFVTARTITETFDENEEATCVGSLS